MQIAKMYTVPIDVSPRDTKLITNDSKTFSFSTLLQGIIEEKTASTQETVNQKDTAAAFATMRNNSIQMSALKRSSFKDDSGKLLELREIPEGENNFCSMCGSKIEPDGSCPICIVPIFIHGTSTPLAEQISQAGSNQKVSQVDGSDSTSAGKSAVSSKSNKVGKKK